MSFPDLSRMEAHRADAHLGGGAGMFDNSSVGPDSTNDQYVSHLDWRQAAGG
jgi:hypothetical protein